MRIPRALLLVLVVLNAVVLLGEVWPEGAPPFARVVNVAFLAGNLVVLLLSLRAPTRGEQPHQS